MILTLPVKPTFQLLAEYVTAQLLVVDVGSVVNVTGALAADTLPAASLARTAYTYAVPAVRPVSVVDADVGEATRVEVVPWTRYTS